MTFVVGLTGGIGSGKSAVSNAFAALGVEVTDTDQLSYALTDPGEPGHAGIVHAFGRGVLRADGTLDRQHLRAKVFADDASRARLLVVSRSCLRVAICWSAAVS